MPDSESIAHSRVSRRSFVAAGSVAAGAVVGANMLAAPAAGKVLGANDRIQFGVIGVGGMGSGHVGDLVGRAERDNIRCAAVCDVYQKRLNQNRERCDGEAFADYRKLLDRKDIDAVIIATPDHWHSKQAIDAMKAGKDVYLQKPMTLTIEQAIEVRDAAKRLKKKLQVGTQYASEPETWAARKAIADGRIGKVIWSQNGYCRNSREGQFNWPIDAAASPDATGENHVDWDMWLGHEFGRAEDSLEPRSFFPLPQILGVQRRRRHGPALSRLGAARAGHGRAPGRIPPQGRRRRRPVRRKRWARHSRQPFHAD